MAKPFYSLEEVCEMLGKTPDEVRKLVREGTLREFRDAGKIFFKAEDVAQLSGGEAASGDTSEIELEAAEETPDTPDVPDVGPPPQTSLSGGTSIIGLEPMEEERPEGEKEDTVITASGIGVFDDDELEIDADPMAETQITAGPIDDQVSLESAGSGSGLLDLTRESDDTSLGAELLDEIYPGEGDGGEAAAPETPAAEPVEEAEEPEAEAEEALPAVGMREEVVTVVRAAPADPYEGLFSGFLVAALILLGVAGSVVGGTLQGFLPDYATWLTDNFYIFLAGAGLLLVLCVVIGMFVGRAFSPRPS